MNYKLIGALLIISSCGCCGFLSAAYHASDIRMFENLIHALDFMVCELQYRATPLPQLCRQAGGQCSGKIGKVFIALSDELESQISPDVGICMSSVICRFEGFNRSLSSVLLELGNQLGCFDLPGQIRVLEHCRDQSAAKLKQLNENKESRLRSYRTLGLCAGAAIAILFV